MLHLSNGHSFRVACSSGALAYGRGWWWERLFLAPMGVIDPDQFTIITKTLTMYPREGNLRMHAPWRCVFADPVSGRTVNSVGMTNPGLQWWLEEGYHHNVGKTGRKVIVSIWPESQVEAGTMGAALNRQIIEGVEVNVSCPNVKMKLGDKVEHIVKLVNEVVKSSRHPVGLKLSALDPIVPVAQELRGKVEWLDLINTVPYSKLYPSRKSPLARYGLEGGVSGPVIADHAVAALNLVKKAGIRTPVISGGGIWNLADAKQRFRLGASAITLGTLFLLRPWRPNRIAKALQRTP